MTSVATAAVGNSFKDRIERPLFIVSTPRSGSTLLFETFAQSPDLFSISGESHFLIEGLPALSLPNRGWASNRLIATDAAPEVVEQLAERFYAALRDRDGRAADGPVRMLEKTPKNALRVDFFAAAWSDARFVYLYRQPRQTLASMIEAWTSGRFRTYPMLPGWSGAPWSLLLIPGWRELIGKPLPDIVARQWATTTDILLEDLERLSPARVFALNYDVFLAAPQRTMQALTHWAGVEWDRDLNGELPLSRYTVSQPHADKWRRIEGMIQEMLPLVAAADERARRFVSRRENADG